MPPVLDGIHTWLRPLPVSASCFVPGGQSLSVSSMGYSNCQRFGFERTPQFQGPQMEWTVFVTSLPNDMNKAWLATLFSAFGSIKGIEFIRRPAYGRKWRMSERFSNRRLISTN